jgi:hypothetical protein
MMGRRYIHKIKNVVLQWKNQKTGIRLLSIRADPCWLSLHADGEAEDSWDIIQSFSTILLSGS